MVPLTPLMVMRDVRLSYVGEPAFFHAVTASRGITMLARTPAIRVGSPGTMVSVTMAGFASRVNSFRAEPPVNYARCPVLTDDYAPMDGLSRTDN